MNTGLVFVTKNPNRAGSPICGSKLNTGTLALSTPNTPGSLNVTSATPITVCSGHVGKGLWKDSASEQRLNGVGFPIIPGGRLNSRSFGNATGTASSLPKTLLNSPSWFKATVNVV